jgi:hypothetical protein
MRYLATRRAFTLVDAAAAVLASGALAALAAAALPGLSRADLAAQNRANLMTIGQAAAQWSADHQDLIVGAPGASARELLNDPAALNSLALETAGLATQPFDWASPLAWGYLTQAPPPDRRDERFVKAFGLVPIFNKNNGEVADLTHPGPLGILRDPAQHEISLPFFDNSTEPDGIEETYFTPQIATSYVAAREFLWWGQSSSQRPRWAGPDFWGFERGGTFHASQSFDVPDLPGAEGPEAPGRSYRPALERVGDPSRKIQIADGTRFQRFDLRGIDHDVNADASFGGAFADIGAWADDENQESTLTRAWPSGVNQSGQDMTRISFRHGDAQTPRGHTLRFDGSVILMDIAGARDPALWLPRGTTIPLNDVPKLFRDQYEQEGDVLGPVPAFQRVIIW